MPRPSGSGAAARVMSRRRAAAMLGAAAVCAGLAVSAVDRYAGEVEAQVGPLVPVVVATARHRPGRTVTRRVAATLLAERLVPQRFAPPGALRSRADAVGFEVAAGLAAGDYVGAVAARRTRGPAARRARWSGDARIVEVGVAGTQHDVGGAARRLDGGRADHHRARPRGAPHASLRCSGCRSWDSTRVQAARLARDGRSVGRARDAARHAAPGGPPDRRGQLRARDPGRSARDRATTGGCGRSPIPASGSMTDLSTVDDVAQVLRRRLVEEARLDVGTSDPATLRYRIATLLTEEALPLDGAGASGARRQGRVRARLGSGHSSR